MFSKFTFELNRKVILGKGQHSVVYEGTFRRSKVAIKRIELARFNRNLDMYTEQRKILSLDHPNVVKMLSIQDGVDFKFFVMEKCAASLYDYYKNGFSGLVPSALKGLLDMAQGLRYIHSDRKLAHRNLKPGNVLISIPDDRGVVVLKLSDFSFSKLTAHSISFSTTGLGGTKNFLPPEILVAYDQGIDDSKSNVIEMLQSSDIFALGCIFFTYVTRGRHPFGLGTSIPRNIIEGKPDLTGIESDELVHDLVTKMIANDPTERPSADKVVEALLQHPANSAASARFQENRGIMSAFTSLFYGIAGNGPGSNSGHMAVTNHIPNCIPSH